MSSISSSDWIPAGAALDLFGLLLGRLRGLSFPGMLGAVGAARSTSTSMTLIRSARPHASTWCWTFAQGRGLFHAGANRPRAAQTAPVVAHHQASCRQHRHVQQAPRSISSYFSWLPHLACSSRTSFFPSSPAHRAAGPAGVASNIGITTSVLLLQPFLWSCFVGEFCDAFATSAR